jgi:hypothetical protein
MAPGSPPSKRARRSIQDKNSYNSSLIRRILKGINKFDKLVKRNKKRSEEIVARKERLMCKKRELQGILNREREELLDIQNKMREAAATLHSKISNVLVGGARVGDGTIVEASNFLAGTGSHIVQKMARIEDLQKAVVVVGDNLNKLVKIQDDVRIEGTEIPALEETVDELQDNMSVFLNEMKYHVRNVIVDMVSDNDCESDEEESEPDNEDNTVNPEDMLGAEDINPSDMDAFSEWGRRTPYCKGKPFGGHAFASTSDAASSSEGKCE